MAKQSKPVAARPYPSEFGSHKGMVDTEETEKLPNKERPVFTTGTNLQELIDNIEIEYYQDMVVCRDQFGLYTTERRRLDNGQADPNRCAGSRINYGK